MTTRFTSRKFLLTLGAILIAVGSALTGETPWPQATWTTLLAVLGYLGIEGIRDIRLPK